MLSKKNTDGTPACVCSPRYPCQLPHQCFRAKEGLCLLLLRQYMGSSPDVFGHSECQPQAFICCHSLHQAQLQGSSLQVCSCMTPCCCQYVVCSILPSLWPVQGVPLNQGNLASSLTNIIATYELSPEDKSLVVMPLFHVHGLMAGLDWFFPHSPFPPFPSPPLPPPPPPQAPKATTTSSRVVCTCSLCSCHKACCRQLHTVVQLHAYMNAHSQQCKSDSCPWYIDAVQSGAS